MSMMVKNETQKLDRQAALEELRKEEQVRKSPESSKKEERKSVYAGETNLVQEDSVLAEKIKAQRTALKELLDQHLKEVELDEGVEQLESGKEDLLDSMNRAYAEQEKVREMRRDFQEEYGVTEDTPEDQLPESERYLADMEQFDEMERVWADEARAAQDAQRSINQTLTDISIERAKSHAMVDAQERADEIMEETSEEVIDMLQQEAVDHIDEKLEEIIEAAEKKAEEEEEKDEKLDKLHEAGDQIEVNRKKKPIKTPDLDLDDLQKTAKKILREEAILEEDIKGIAVDEHL